LADILDRNAPFESALATFAEDGHHVVQRFGKVEVRPMLTQFQIRCGTLSNSEGSRPRKCCVPTGCVPDRAASKSSAALRLRRSQRVRVFKPGGRSTGSQVQVKVGQVSDSRRDPVGYARRCGYADGGSVSAERKQRNHCRSSTQPDLPSRDCLIAIPNAAANSANDCSSRTWPVGNCTNVDLQQVVHN
jgi:hypothetical protein